MQRKAIFLDRDGVLNESVVRHGKPFPPASLNELRVADDVLPALEMLKEMDYLLIGATNQPDVARGTTPRSVVEAINAALMQQLPLNEILVCYHDNQDQCACRKPLPGLLTQAADIYDIDLKNSFMIGDRWKDVEAGARAGCKTVWLNRDYDEQVPKTRPDFTARSMMEAAIWIQDTIISMQGESDESS